MCRLEVGRWQTPLNHAARSGGLVRVKLVVMNASLTLETRSELLFNCTFFARGLNMSRALDIASIPGNTYGWRLGSGLSLTGILKF
jgi:hypothetical protein